MEPFGAHERPWTPEEKEKIKNFLKFDHHVPLKIAEMVYTAEAETEYFDKVGDVLGAAGTGIAYFFPMIRTLPLYWRLGAAAAVGGSLYWWGHSTAEDLRWGRVYGAYQKFVQYHGQHVRLFV